MKDFTTPKRVWINSPATTQPFHKLHGKTGIAIVDKHGDTVVYFATGLLHAQRIDPLYLETANSHTDIFEVAEEVKTINFTEGSIIDNLIGVFTNYQQKSKRITDVIFLDGVLAVLDSSKDDARNCVLKNFGATEFAKWLLKQDITTHGIKVTDFVDAKGNIITLEDLYTQYMATQTV